MKISYMITGAALLFLGIFIKTKFFMAVGIIFLLVSFFGKKEEKKTPTEKESAKIQTEDESVKSEHKCPNCKTKLLPDDNFCPECGKKVLP